MSNKIKILIEESEDEFSIKSIDRDINGDELIEIMGNALVTILVSSSLNEWERMTVLSRIGRLVSPGLAQMMDSFKGTLLNDEEEGIH